MKVSLILKTWNALLYTKLCLKSLVKNTDPSLYELIIVDNGSTDGTLEFLYSFPKIHVISNNHNLGWMAGNRLGLEVANEKWICLLDNDIFFTPDWLNGLIYEIEKNKFSKLAAVSPLQVHPYIKHPYFPNQSTKQVWVEIQKSNTTKSPYILLKKFFCNNNLNRFLRDIANINKNWNNFVICPPDFVSGCCLLLDREAIALSGGFDENIFGIYGADDIDLSWRLSEKGFLIMRSNRSYIHHFKHASIIENNINKNILNKKTSDILFSKWEHVLQSWIKNNIKNKNKQIELSEKYFLIKNFLEWCECKNK